MPETPFRVKCVNNNGLELKISATKRGRKALMPFALAFYGCTVEIKCKDCQRTMGLEAKKKHCRCKAPNPVLTVSQWVP